MTAKDVAAGPERLACIDKLTVGPVVVEPRRLRAPYVVRVGDQETVHELAYRWEEDVFDPADAGDRNLALLVASQVAINYGLFCREIEFVGDLDRHDRRFLEEYVAHTAREIYAIKFLGENPFLDASVKGLSADRRDTWSNARLVFGGDEPPGGRFAWKNVSPERHAVLASGGKDSLLTHALLAETGREVHPIFVNESGRHWFTALNAYRHFSAEVPRTARVWTNSDRVFSAMLSHLPFVRADWHRLRADIYPVRLWTVAVFLFGALPLMKKRGIGNISIGSEHDTTQRSSTGHVTHYSGLYDQSRWFDQALSRWYRRKGWPVLQYSVLRPLSEFLIQKILVERYPDLQRLQVSCHASHKNEATGSIRPCGRCEKCRRIVSMLSAIGADPSRCGYESSAVEPLLRDLRARGLHQESAGVEHVEHLLVVRGLLPAAKSAKAHEEIENLRFDQERSPVETLPRALRGPLHRILLETAQGALIRQGRRWVPIDALSPAVLDPPHPLEVPAPSPTVTPTRETTGSSPVTWASMTWPEAEERLKTVDVALLPVGAIEQHGPHLPLDVDAYDAERLAREVAERCVHPRPLVLPLVPYGVSYHHDDFAGTISVGPDTLSRLVVEIGTQVARQGIRKLVIINGHGGNGPALHFAAQIINRDTGIFTCVDTGETSDADIDALTRTPNDVHAGEIETSTTMALRPEAVRTDRMEPAVPRFSSHFLDFTSKRGVGWYAHTERITASGVMGDPTAADEEKGRRMWKVIVDNLVELVEDLSSMTLDEIFQRRY